MSFLQLVLSLDKTIKEIILFWRICQFDRYRNKKFLQCIESLLHKVLELVATPVNEYCNSAVADSGFARGGFPTSWGEWVNLLFRKIFAHDCMK